MAQARLIIELLQAKAALVDDLEAETDLLRTELVLLRNRHTNGHSVVSNGEDILRRGHLATAAKTQIPAVPMRPLVTRVADGIPGEPT